MARGLEERGGGEGEEEAVGFYRKKILRGG